MSDSTPQPYVSIERVTKRFGDFTAVDDMILAMDRGELFAFSRRGHFAGMLQFRAERRVYPKRVHKP
jgi:hypothetical protein